MSAGSNPSKHETLKHCCLMLGQRRRRWTNIKTEEFQWALFVGMGQSESTSYLNQLVCANKSLHLFLRHHNYVSMFCLCYSIII